MQLLPVSVLFEIYGGLYPYPIERLDVAQFDGFVANNNMIVNAPHILIVSSPHEDINKSVLGVDDKTIMVFSGEQDAYNFQETLVKLFKIRFFAGFV